MVEQGQQVSPRHHVVRVDHCHGVARLKQHSPPHGHFPVALPSRQNVYQFAHRLPYAENKDSDLQKLHDPGSIPSEFKRVFP